MKFPRILKYTVVFASILFFITTVFSYSLSSSIDTYFNNGLLDNLEVKQKSDYSKTYYYKEVEMESYPSYREAMLNGKTGILLYAENGLVYNRKTLVGTQSLILDYNWLSTGEFNKEEIKNYFKENKILTNLRTTYLTQSLWYMILLFFILLLATRYISPTIIFLLSTVVTYFKYKTIPEQDNSSERLKFFELYRGIVHTKTLNRLEKSKEIILFASLFTYFTILSLNTNGTLSYLPSISIPLILAYVGVLSILLMHLVNQTVTDNENIVLEKELAQKLNLFIK